MRKNREKRLNFKAEGQEFAKKLGSLEQFIRTVKGKNNLHCRFLVPRNTQKNLTEI